MPAQSTEGELPNDSAVRDARHGGMLLLLSVFVIAVCGLVYELIAGTLSSYLLGDSVTQFSLVIGIFLFAMGIGSFLSRFIRSRLLACFIAIQCLIGLIGGISTLVAFVSFTFSDSYLPTLFTLLFLVGALVGIEIPLIIRILQASDSLRVTTSNVLSLDYLGALVASLIFPFLLVPHLGLVRAGAAMGLLNLLVAALMLWRFRVEIGRARRPLTFFACTSALLLIVVSILSGRWVSYLENQLYQDEIILARDTSYQRIVITRWRDDVRLYLNGHLQFSSLDEYRYHEALVHPATSLAQSPRQVLVLGGGDGLAVRELLKYAEIERVDLVDIDPEVTELFRRNSMLVELNQGALQDPRVHIHNTDAMQYLSSTIRQYDVVIVDLPDPSDAHLAKLYSQPFYRLVGRALNENGVMAVQATSPFRSREAFWCIKHTIESCRVGPDNESTFYVQPYHTHVPTFGSWGFVIASRQPLDPVEIDLRVPAKFLNQQSIGAMFVFSEDIAEVKTPVSGLVDPVVNRLYRESYHRMFN